MTSEMMEKERSVVQIEMSPGPSLLLSWIRRITRAICVLARSRKSMLALYADSTFGAQITKLSTLVRTFVFWLIRILSAAMCQRNISSSSTCSMRTCFPAQGKRRPGVVDLSVAIPCTLHHLVEQLCSLEQRCAISFVTRSSAQGLRHLRPSRQMNSSAACGPHVPDS